MKAGWQDDKVGLGYAAALVTLTSPTYGCLCLSGFHHPRNTMSLPRLQKMVYAAEKRPGRRPRRRTELVEQRLRVSNKVVARRLDWLSAQLAKQKELLGQLETLSLAVAQLEAEVATLEATYRVQECKEKPHSRLAGAQRKLTKASERLQKAERAAATHRARLNQLEVERAELKAHLDRLRTENENNPDPITIILRMDAGFGAGPNITWLIEMGYIFLARRFSPAAKFANSTSETIPLLVAHDLR